MKLFSRIINQSLIFQCIKDIANKHSLTHKQNICREGERQRKQVNEQCCFWTHFIFVIIFSSVVHRPNFTILHLSAKKQQVWVKVHRMALSSTIFKCSRRPLPPNLWNFRGISEFYFKPFIFTFQIVLYVFFFSIHLLSSG